MAKINPLDIAIPFPVSSGGTGQSSVQDAINSLTGADVATTGQVLTKLASGNAGFQTPLEGGEQFLYHTITTTDGSQATVGQIQVPSDRAITFSILVSARGPSNKHYWAKIDGGARRDAGGNAVLIGTRQKLSDHENSPGYDVDIDVSGTDLRIRVTGASSESVVWESKILYNSDAAGEDLIASKSILRFETTTTNGSLIPLGDIAVPDDSNMSFWILVSGHLDSASVDKNYWAVIKGSARRRAGGNATLVGSRFITEDDEGSPGYSADVVASGNDLRVNVTGAAGETVNWTCKLIFVSDSTSEQLIDFLPVYSNNRSLKWRNGADNADIGIINLSTNDNTLINAPTSASLGILLRTGDVNRWQVDGNGYLIQQAGGLDLVFLNNNRGIEFRGSNSYLKSDQTFSIRLDTSDGSDNQHITVAGGGADERSRGGYLSVFGNEDPSFPGVIALTAGDTGNIQFWSQGFQRWQIDSAGDLLPQNSYTIGSNSQGISQLYGNSFRPANSGNSGKCGIQGGNNTDLETFNNGAGVTCFGINHGASREGRLLLSAGDTAGDIRLFTNGSLSWQITDAGNFVYHNSNPYICATTSDGSDSSSFRICGGGSVSSDRGAYIRLYGNEAATYPGDLHLIPGNPNGDVSIWLSGSGPQWKFDHTTGDFMTVTSGVGISVVAYSTRSSLIAATNAQGSSWTGTCFYGSNNVVASGSWSYLRGDYLSNNGRAVDLKGDGNCYCDGSWSGGGADYAEYFESAGENIPMGSSVVLDENNPGFVRASVPEDAESDILGVIRPKKSGTSASIGNAPMNWPNMYLRDEYGECILGEDGLRQLNPEWDETQEYVLREERPEWYLISLLGQVAITKGQLTNPSWRKIKDLSENVELWFIR